MSFQRARHFDGINTSAERALGCLKDAALGWRVEDDVKSGGMQSPLAVACAGLRRLGRADGVVEVCLLAAKNFVDDQTFAGAARGGVLALGGGGSGVSFEQAASFGHAGGGGGGGGGGGAGVGVAGDQWLAGLAREGPPSDPGSVRSSCHELAVLEVASVLNDGQPYPVLTGAGLNPQQRQELATRAIDKALR